jgi:3-deoxy-D-manno-octulosonate 8-phosphate phosphatase (KDO 8-P phosphatase)
VSAGIRLLVLDVDGVLTDGRLWFDAAGEALKVFHVRDGHGIKAVLQAGIAVAVVSGRSSPAVTRRCAELGISYVEQGCADKVAALNRLTAALGVAAADTACLVDDTPDLGLMAAVGHAFAVADAHPQVRKLAQRVTEAPGGAGAVREVCDWLVARRP